MVDLDAEQVESPVLAVNAEKLIVDWMLATTAVTALIDDRTYTAVPARPAWPLVRTTRIGGTRELWLDHPLLQIDVWGGPKATALEVIETIAAHAKFGLLGEHELGVVTEVLIGGPRWDPDSSYEPARPRYSLDISLTTHP